MIFALTVLASYLIGSIPSAVWIGRAVSGVDVRQHGSGNMGATNVARVLGVRWALVVGVMDMLKGFAPTFWLGPIAGVNVGLTIAAASLIIGATAILGHLFPVFAGFKGGKGVLTASGVFLALLPLEVGIALGVWAVVFALSRIVSLGSLIAAITLAVTVLVRRYVFGVPIGDSLVAAAVLLCLLVIITHRSNIKRLLRGEETRFRDRKTAAPSS